MLYPYQKIGAQWLSKMQLALLADDMGLGKSAQGVVACDLVQAKRILVVAPAVARVNWHREFLKFSSSERSCCVVTNQHDEIKDANLVIISYDLAATKLHSILISFTWDVVILDESHYLKGLDANRSQKILGKNGIVRKSKRVWALSGTPAPNHAGELWTLLYTFGVTTLKYDAFLGRYCDTIQTGYGVRVLGTKHSAIPELQILLSKIMLRRKKSEVMKELPPITYSNLYVEPGEVDLDTDPALVEYVFPHDRRDELKSILEHERGIVNHIIQNKDTGFNKAAALEAMASSVATLRKFLGAKKVKPIADLVRQELESKAYQKIVIFAVHQNVIVGLQRALEDLGVVTLYGKTPIEKRQSNIDRFMNHPRTQIFIGNIKACGTAITLTSSHQVLILEPSWCPADNAQAIMRVHRISQKFPVSARFVQIQDDPLENSINRILKRKTIDTQLLFDDRGASEINRNLQLDELILPGIDGKVRGDKKQNNNNDEGIFS